MTDQLPLTIKAPFTREQVDALTRWQTSGMVHEMTCLEDGDVLVATTRGMVCPFCNEVQGWAPAVCLEEPMTLDEVFADWRRDVAAGKYK